MIGEGGGRGGKEGGERGEGIGRGGGEQSIGRRWPSKQGHMPLSERPPLPGLTFFCLVFAVVTGLPELLEAPENLT